MQSVLVDNTFLDQAETIRKLGQGTYGEVKLIKVSSGELYAVKYIKIKENGISMDALKETDSLILLRSTKEIIQLRGISQTSDTLAVIMEPAEMDLWKYVTSTPFPDRMRLFPELFSTLVQITRIFRRVGLTHYDISPKNILVKEGHFKIADFGLSMRGFSLIPPTTNPVYVLNYRPPEYLYSRDFETFKSYSGDVWAMGLVLIDFIRGTMFYSHIEDEEMMKERIHKTSTLADVPSETFTQMNKYGVVHGAIRVKEKLEGRVETKYIDLLEEMLNLNPNDRPNSVQLMKSLKMSEDLPEITQPEDRRAVDEKVSEITKMSKYSSFSTMTILMAIELYTRYLGTVGSEKHPLAHLAALRISSEYNARGLYEISSIPDLLAVIKSLVLISEMKAAEEDLLKKLNFSIFRDELVDLYSRVYYEKINLWETSISEFAKPLDLWFMQ